MKLVRALPLPAAGGCSRGSRSRSATSTGARRSTSSRAGAAARPRSARAATERRPPIVVAALAALLGCSPGPRPAPPASVAPQAAAPVEAPRQRLDVDAEALDLAEVMERIGRQVGRTILVDPALQESVTVSLRDIAWREAVDVIARLCRCEVEERAGGLLVLCRRVLDVRAWDLPSRAYFHLIARVAGRNVIVSPSVHGPPVTARLDGWRWDALLEAHARSLDAVVVQESEDLLRIVPARDLGLASPVETLPWPEPEVTFVTGLLGTWSEAGERPELSVTVGPGDGPIDVALAREGERLAGVARLRGP